MKIILVVTDVGGRNVVFVSDTLRVFPLEEAVRLAKVGRFENVHTVKSGGGGVYLRTKAGVSLKGQLDRISISPHRLFSSVGDIHHAFSTPAFVDYWESYQRALEVKKSYITINGYPRVLKKEARKKIKAHRRLILDAAEKFVIDPYLLAAIIIDEIARLGPVEPILDALAVYMVGVNTSVGIAQIKIETARGLIKDGYYNPDPIQFPQQRIDQVSRQHLYGYLKEPKHNVFFAAARIRGFIDTWKKFVDLKKRPEIIATLYSLEKRKPHRNPKPNERGLQISGEFYQLAKKLLWEK